MTELHMDPSAVKVPFVVKGDYMSLTLKSLLEAGELGDDAVMHGTYHSHTAPFGAAGGSYIMLAVGEAEGLKDGIVLVPVADVACFAVQQTGPRQKGRDIQEGTSGA